MPPWETQKDRRVSERVTDAWFAWLAAQERAAYREDAERTEAKRRGNPHNRADKSARRPGAAKGGGGKRATATGVLPGATATRGRPPGGAGGSDKPGIAEIAAQRVGMDEDTYQKQLAQIEHDRTAYRKGGRPAPGGISGGGTGMAGGSIDEAKANIAGAIDKVGTAEGAVQQAIAEYEAAIAQMMAAMEGSSQSEASSAVGALQEALQHLQDAAGMGQSSTKDAETVAARL